jgi:hypothetical protein
MKKRRKKKKRSFGWESQFLNIRSSIHSFILKIIAPNQTLNIRIADFFLEAVWKARNASKFDGVLASSSQLLSSLQAFLCIYSISNPFLVKVFGGLILPFLDYFGLFQSSLESRQYHGERKMLRHTFSTLMELLKVTQLML